MIFNEHKHIRGEKAGFHQLQNFDQWRGAGKEEIFFFAERTLHFLQRIPSEELASYAIFLTVQDPSSHAYTSFTRSITMTRSLVVVQEFTFQVQGTRSEINQALS
ncbi:hypothetical protein KIL84_020766 [Mauremys mutica]|uniref:Uncharacterized protein n=1 Tax=Mauremys mutica TaxID=74926 RepID=A0A9D3X9R0_9SAUR|nr:hypothetical protein KIL84_020766 [Mauremys mutica]